jgi:hypothetical protein
MNAGIVFWHRPSPHPSRSLPTFNYFLNSSGVRQSIWYCGHYWPIVQAPDDDGDCGVNGGMKIGRGNRSTRRKPAPMPLCPPQIPHDLTRARTRAAAVRSQWLTAGLLFTNQLTETVRRPEVQHEIHFYFHVFTVCLSKTDFNVIHIFISRRSSGIFPGGFPINIQLEFLVSSVLVTCRALS